MQGLLSQTMWARVGIELLKSCSVHPTTMPRLIFSQWGVSWPNFLQCDHFSQVNRNRTKWLKYVKSWALQLVSTGLMASNWLSNSDTNSHNISRKTWTWWSKMQVMKRFNLSKTCSSMTLQRGRQHQNVFNIPFSVFECQFQSVLLKTNRLMKR